MWPYHPPRAHWTADTTLFLIAEQYVFGFSLNWFALETQTDSILTLTPSTCFSCLDTSAIELKL